MAVRKVSKPKIIGYVVTGSSGPYSLHTDAKNSILWLNGPTTLFSTRERAEDAIERTEKYRVENKLAWPWLANSFASPVSKEI